MENLKKRVDALRETDDIIKKEMSVRNDYNALHGIDTSEKAMAILRQYNLPWTQWHLLHDRTIPEYMKSASNASANQIIKTVLGFSFLYRLNFIKQLGTVSFFKNLDGSHHRLPHAIGTAETAAMMLESLTRRLVDNPLSEAAISDTERKAVILYALIHDCFHGPLGHTLEPLRGVLLEDDIRRIDKFFLEKNIENGDLLMLIRQVATDSEEEKRIRDLLVFLSTEDDDPFQKYEDRYFLKQIVDYQIDADRFDYLVRDGYHLGRGVPAKQPWIDMLQSARVVTIDLPDVSGGTYKRKVLAYANRWEREISGMLNFRSNLYEEYYEHPDKLAVDEMVCHTIYYHLRALNIVGTSSENTSKKEFIDQFMKLTDENIFPFLLAIQCPFPAKEILNDIIGNRHFSVIEAIGFKPAGAKRLTDESRAFSKRIDLEKEQYLEKKYPQTLSGRLKEGERFDLIFGAYKKEPISDEALILYFALMMYDCFDVKVAFEQNLWKAVLKEEDVASAWRTILDRNYGSQGLERYSEFENIPQIHLTLPLFRGYVTEENLLQYVHERQDTKMTTYDENGKITFVEPSIKYAVHTYTTYSVILSGQVDICKNQRFKEIVSEKFRSMVKSFNWLAEKLTFNS